MNSNIVITGAAIVSPLGLTRDETFAAVVAGKCGMTRLTAIECDLPDGRDGGEAPALDPAFCPNEAREVRYLRKAILDALADAGLSQGCSYRPERRAVMLGTTLHGMRAAGEFLRTNDYACLSRFLASHVIAKATCGLGYEGLGATTCSACSSSLGSIALGVTLLESGDFDVVIAGGYDPVSEYAYAGFNSLRLVSEGPLRPFTLGRTGMKLSEGYGIVVLERAEDARGRKHKPLARIAGFGESADAHHLTQPHPAGEGAARAMRQAIADAGLTPENIGLVVAHATGTPDNDASEYAALKAVFGDALPSRSCVAFKSHLGHTLGGAGAVELILGAMAMQRQTVPPCANVTPDAVEFADLPLTHSSARQAKVKAVLSTSLGFGGANTCVVITPPDDAPDIRIEDAQAVITGIGVLVPGAVGNQAFIDLLSREATFSGAIPEDQFAHLINARRARRLSDYVKLLLAATTLAMQDAAVGDAPGFARDCSVILGSMHGSSNYCETYYRQVVTEGFAAANPMLFAEGVPNAGSAHVSLALGVQGGCQTIIGSRTSGLDALALAARRIQTGRWQRAIVGAAEEYSDLTQAAYRHCGDETLRTSSAAVVFVLESRSSATARGARPHGTVTGYTSRISYEQMHRSSQLSDHSYLYPRIGETFSVGPMACIAAELLRSRQVVSVRASDPSGIVSTVELKVRGDA